MENLHRPQKKKKKKFHFDLETEKKKKHEKKKNTWTGLKEENVSRNEKMRKFPYDEKRRRGLNII